jgi:hypothetical protein
MRKSSTSVEQYHLGSMLEQIHEGSIGLPEFQRDFDWGIRDIRSLLATVFSGWPAGSLLLLEGGKAYFEMRAMEGAPPLGSEVDFSVLDGQQRLTSLYQALYDTGAEIFALRWDVANTEDDIEEAIVSYKPRRWEAIAGSFSLQLKNKLIPLSSLRSASTFFKWRDEMFSSVKAANIELIKEEVTDAYTYRLSAIHDYEFPVVKISKRAPISSIARIFEKVNRTGLTLNTFDLMVAKTFEKGWNLRDEWVSSKERHPNLAFFFGEDGLPLLQSIALLRRSDIRQAAVLELVKRDVQSEWREVSAAAHRVVNFLRDECGVGRKDFMPYSNMLPVMVALERKGMFVDHAERIKRWFWVSAFGALYDAAANTRLVAHYRLLSSDTDLNYDKLELSPFTISEVSRKSSKAAWNAVNCAIFYELERSGLRFPDDLMADLEVSQLFSMKEVQVTPSRDKNLVDSEYRSAANSFLVPKRFMRIARSTNSEDTIELLRASTYSKLCDRQIALTGFKRSRNWREARDGRENWIGEFANQQGVMTYVQFISVIS